MFNSLSAATTSGINIGGSTLNGNPVILLRTDTLRSGDCCLESGCGRSLVGLGGNLKFGANCSKCARPFCDTHLDFHMRLSPQSFAHDPDAGVMSRVCGDCFSARKGFREWNGKTRTRNVEFMQLRQKRVDKLNLEVNRLNNRLQKLAEIHQTYKLPNSQSSTPQGSPLPIRKVQQQILVEKSSSAASGMALKAGRSLREAEQTVTNWQPDADVSECPFCHIPFGRWLSSNRKHHCRLCGRVVCGNCSQTFPLFSSSPSAATFGKDNSSFLLSADKQQQQRSSSRLSASSSRASSTTEMSGSSAAEQCGRVLVCNDCKHLTFHRRKHLEESTQIPALVKIYEVSHSLFVVLFLLFCNIYIYIYVYT